MVSTLETLYWIVTGVLIAAMFASWLVFAQLSMRGIERRLMADGYPRPAPWDEFGLRALWYAWAIALPVGVWNRKDDPLIDVALVRDYATWQDRLRGTVLLLSGALFLIVSVVGGTIGGYY